MSIRTSVFTPNASSTLKSSVAFEPNLILAASFGHLIPAEIIDWVPPLHALNIHPSLLPRYRGPAPLQWTIANSDTTTGTSIQELSKGVFDRGKILAQVQVDKPPDINYWDFELLMAQRSADLFHDLLRSNYEQVKALAKGQEGIATVAPRITRETTRIDWAEQTAQEVVQYSRAFDHHFHIWTTYQDHVIQLSDVSVSHTNWQGTSGSPGSVTLYKGALYIQCKEGLLQVQKVTVDNKKLLAPDWWNRHATKGKRKKIMHFV